MAIENAIAQFGQRGTGNVGAGIGYGLQARRMAMMGKQQEFENQNTLAQIEQRNRQAAEQAEMDFSKGAVEAYLNAPPEARGNVLQGFVDEAVKKRYMSPEQASEVDEAFMQRMAGKLGVQFPQAKIEGAPSDVRSYEYFANLTPKQREEFLNVKRAGQVLNLGDRSIVRSPTGQETIYDRGVPEEKTPDFVADVETAKQQAMLDVEKQANAPKAEEKVRQLTKGVDNTVSAIDEALDLVNWKTTGLIGKAMSGIAGTDAYALKQTALTVRANIGFDRLQAMRDASPTGGALGQVAIQELEALQASIASLDQGLGPEQLAANLNKVKQHYQNWKDAVQLSYDEQYGGADGLKAGTVEDGYEFLGGDPSDPKNWKKQ